jgi:hypothetical protein
LRWCSRSLWGRVVAQGEGCAAQTGETLTTALSHGERVPWLGSGIDCAVLTSV